MRSVEENPAAVTVANIKYFQNLHGISDEVLAKKMGISRATWSNRKNRPQLMTVKEIIAAVSFFNKKGAKITAAQMMSPMTPSEIKPWEGSK